MNGCREFESLIDRERAGEKLTAAERDLLADHLEACAACDELFDLVSAVRDPVAEEPSEDELAEMRRRVRASLARPVVVPFGRRGAVSGGSRWLAAAAALVGVTIGWLAATASLSAHGSAMEAVAESPLAAAGELVGELRRAAVRHASFEQTADAPYLFRNVRLEAVGGERVRLGFDVSRHLDLDLDRDDPLLAEVLVQTMLETDSVGSRLAAIEAAPPGLEPKVRRALIVAMRTDTNLGVRLRAQERLAAIAADDKITRAMLEVLADEGSVEMRFAAIDYLARNGVSPRQVEEAIGDAERPGDRAVRVRARDYLTAAERL